YQSILRWIFRCSCISTPSSSYSWLSIKMNTLLTLDIISYDNPSLELIIFILIPFVTKFHICIDFCILRIHITFARRNIHSVNFTHMYINMWLDKRYIHQNAQKCPWLSELLKLVLIYIIKICTNFLTTILITRTLQKSCIIRLTTTQNITSS